MKKIMFNEQHGLQQAVFDGRMTMVHQVVPPKLFECCISNSARGNEDEIRERLLANSKYKVGEVVAIAQAYKDTPATKDFFKDADFLKKYKWTKGWSNKMFVKPDLMPHHIKITDIKVERLQDISDEDCLREGIMEGEFMNTWDRYYFDEWGDVPNHITFETPRKAFAALIDKVSGKGAWKRNPWVFAYSFERIN